MKKIRVMEFNDGLAKYYRYDKEIDAINLLEEFQKFGLQFDKIYMSMDAEMDMQMGRGYYTIEELKKSLGCYRTGAACKIKVPALFNGIEVEINFTDGGNTIYMVTTDSSLELTSLYENAY